MSEYTPLFARDVKVPDQLNGLLRPTSTLRHVNEELMGFYCTLLSNCIKTVNAQLQPQPQQDQMIDEERRFGSKI